MTSQSLDAEVEIIFLEKNLGFSKELAIAITESKLEFMRFLQNKREARE